MRVCLLLITLVLAACENQPSRVDLFNPDQEDWVIGGDAEWSMIDGEIIGELDSGSGFVMTKARFENFSLELEFFPDSTVNSGIFVRCSNKELSAEDCYEINIWDLHPNQEWRTGAIVLRESPIAHVNTLNQWNSYRIECDDWGIRAWVNDQLTVELEDHSLTSGFIALQAAGTGKIRFRNVQLTPQ